MGIRPAVVAGVIGGLVATGCGGDQVTSADRAVLEAVVEDHSIGYIEGSVGILQVIDGPTGEVGVRAAALPNEVVGPGVWAGHFEPLQLSPGEYVVRIWMLACDASGCGDDLDEYVELARGRSNPDYSCETSLTLLAGEVSPLAAAIGSKGCIHIGDQPPPRNDRVLTGTVVDEPDAAASGPQISREVRERLAEIALSLDGVPSDARVIRLEPAFDDAGTLSGAVVVVRHAAFTGPVDLPAVNSMEADGREIAVPQVVRYTVESARRMDIAVDLGSGGVVWASPSPKAVIGTELVSTSDVDVEGEPVPPDARDVQGE